MALQPNRVLRRFLQKICSRDAALRPQANHHARCLHSTASHDVGASSASTSTPQRPKEVPLSGLPRFRMKGSDVRVLYEPSIFYKNLLHQIRGAKRRIFLASLYIGKEETELVGSDHKYAFSTMSDHAFRSRLYTTPCRRTRISSCSLWPMPSDRLENTPMAQVQPRFLLAYKLHSRIRCTSACITLPPSAVCTSDMCRSGTMRAGDYGMEKCTASTTLSS